MQVTQDQALRGQQPSKLGAKDIAKLTATPPTPQAKERATRQLWPSSGVKELACTGRDRYDAVHVVLELSLWSAEQEATELVKAVESPQILPLPDQRPLLPCLPQNADRK